MSVAPAMASARRGAAWLAGYLQSDGSFRAAPALTAYYKTPFALASAGYVSEAERVLDYVAARFLHPDGDLEGAGVPWYGLFRIYPHAWLACGALMRGRFEIASPLVRFLAARHDASSGGFFAREDGTVEVMTTSMAALACLWAGRLDLARSSAEWLAQLLDAQPDVRRGFYHVWRNGLVTEFPAEDAESYFVDTTQLKQWYFQYGISAAFLSSLAAATGERRWLELAQRFLHACRHCREDVLERPQSGKIGWGAAWTYRLSGDPADAELARAVVGGLAALQNADGSWNPAGVYSTEPAAEPEPLFDVTSEFIGLQAAIGLVHGI